MEKANIQRSGCLAAGVNAINAYITKGQTPQDMVDYATRDGKGIVRTDLLLTVAQQLNEVTQDLERLGLVFLKDEQGEYVARGLRNIKINGENIKPILAAAAQSQKNVSVFNHVNVTDLIQTEDGIGGAYGFSVNTPIFYEFRAKAVMIATGGAAGLYRPNNAGFSRHKMWYPPFNTGAGYAMVIRAGAEMTTFEMRFVALRCKDTIAPVGTIAQGVSARQVNALGENYEKVYGLATDERVYGTTAEQLAGRGPCYLRTKGITEEQVQDLYKAYLNMAPSQTLKWLESGTSPAEQSVEIAGTEPYIVGGHCASGYWVDTKRMTTLNGLFAAGDVAGGCPQKFVSGALVEGKIAALSAKDYCSAAPALCYDGEQAAAGAERYLFTFKIRFSNSFCVFWCVFVLFSRDSHMIAHAFGIWGPVLRNGSTESLMVTQGIHPSTSHPSAVLLNLFANGIRNNCASKSSFIIHNWQRENVPASHRMFCFSSY